MIKFVPKTIPILYDGVIYQNDGDYEKLLFIHLGIVVKIDMKINSYSFKDLSMNLKKVTIPIEYVRDFNNLTEILGYGRLLLTKEESNKIEKNINIINDNSISISKYGLYIDGQLLLSFNHENKIVKSLNNDIVIPINERKILYNVLLSKINTLGFELNEVIDDTNNQDFIYLLRSIQNRLDITSKN